MYEEETEYSTVTYRCPDAIQNFKIRVLLKHVRDKFIPVLHLDTENNCTSSSALNQNEESESDSEEYSFSWQEKVFSKSELDFYSNLSNCKTKLHERYHEKVKNILKNSMPYKRKLFTYINEDNYKPKDEYVSPTQGGYVSILARRIDNLEISGPVAKNFNNVSKNKVINWFPSADFIKLNHLINPCCEKMFLMVDLGKGEDNKKKISESEEFILCILTYDPFNKILKMYPSFSKEVNARPYCVGNSSHYSSNAYHYWLHHASMLPSEEALKSERRIRNKLIQHQNEIKKLQIGSEFSGQSSNYINVTILGEIISAQDFECDRIVVQYITNLPNGWHCASPETLVGMTQTAVSNEYGITHFCHLFDLELMFDLKKMEEFTVVLPETYFEVLSEDRWKIYRNLGYGYIGLPRSPGIHEFDVTFWRVAENSVRAKLDRFFLGGSQVLQDISYVGMKIKNDKKQVISRYGFQTTPSGVLKIRLNIIHQSEAFKFEKDKKTEIDRNIFARFQTSNLLGSVNTVLEAFRQARERMLRAKETLHINVD